MPNSSLNLHYLEKTVTQNKNVCTHVRKPYYIYGVAPKVQEIFIWSNLSLTGVIFKAFLALRVKTYAVIINKETLKSLPW